MFQCRCGDAFIEALPSFIIASYPRRKGATHAAPFSGRMTTRSVPGGGRTDRVRDLGDGGDGESALLRVLAKQRLVLRPVHAEDLVAGDVALHPLDARAHLLEHGA